MKEYIAKTGGRYTYNDDLLNLQELASSMTAVFDGCQNFIISGCRTIEGRITPGYVWINGRVRHFEGAAQPVLPFYIWEDNHYETITYAGDVNKHGRCCYLCVGAGAVPTVADAVTGELPGFIEITERYAPRLVDKFMGRYALLLDSPFARQLVKKDVTFAGTLSVEKALESHTRVAVTDAPGNRSLLASLGEAGGGSVALYTGGVLVGEIAIAADGAFSFLRQGVRMATFDLSGLSVNHIACSTADIGSLTLDGNDIFNRADATDAGSVLINRLGYGGGNTRYRNFLVYDGRTADPLFYVEGADRRVTVGGTLVVDSDGGGIVLKNTDYAKGDAKLTGTLAWHDKVGAVIGEVGYVSENDFDLTLGNDLGGIVLSAQRVDVQGELCVNGVCISETYVTHIDCTEGLAKKVDKVEGKGLSTEDFTTAYRDKLASIVGATISSRGDGFVSAGDVAAALDSKLTAGSNLGDLSDAGAARANLDVHSRTESDGRYLRVSGSLSEFITLTAAEIESKTPEEIIALREARQQRVRHNIDAERRGTGDLKLAKAANLSDVADTHQARVNLEVYSTEQIDTLLAGKLGSDAAYSGVPFTAEMKTKLTGIKTGVFAGTVAHGTPKERAEGYVSTSAVEAQLALRAPRLLDGYSASDKAAAAANLGVYSSSDADAKFAARSKGLSDLVLWQVGQGKSTAEAKKVIRDNIGAAASRDLEGYLRRDKKLTDLSLSEGDKKLACQTLGAAYAPDYEKKIEDTGWLSCGGENEGSLFARQIGDIVSIQGRINSARRSSNTWGSVATIPNAISPPRYAVAQTLCIIEEGEHLNRGCQFIIGAGSRVIQMYERRAYNWDTELSFTYMT